MWVLFLVSVWVWMQWKHWDSDAVDRYWRRQYALAEMRGCN